MTDNPRQHPLEASIPLVNLALYASLVTASIALWRVGYWPLTVLCWPLTAYFAHSLLLAFHEASHGTLFPTRWRNELQGYVIGSVIFVPLSVYRFVHGHHHSHLATERDIQLWPFVRTGAPRWARILAAIVEVSLEVMYVPTVYAVSAFAGHRTSRRWKLRAAKEYLGCLALWSVVLAVVAHYGAWLELLVGYVVPAVLAGNLQTIRKFTEHMGLFGDSPNTSTRNIVDNSPLGRFLSATMLHVNYHAAHHLHGKTPYYELPGADAAADASEGPVFGSYSSAFLDMLPSLLNPRIGRQWLTVDEPLSLPSAAPAAAERLFRRVPARASNQLTVFHDAPRRR